MAATKKVNVVERGGEFLVLPPMIEISLNGGGAADKLKIKNHTNEALVWISPEFGVTELVLAHTESSIKSPAATTTPGAYDYQIFMVSSSKKAKGNSDPMVIIDP